MSEVKFMVSLPRGLRGNIKREARKNGISMNEYIVTVLEQFIDIQRSNNGTNTKRSDR